MERTKGIWRQGSVNHNNKIFAEDKSVIGCVFNPDDAKFICKAVNYHDRLVEKLDDTVMAINNRHLVADDAVWKSLTSGFKQLLSEIEKD